jgi:sugar/nucleoside kinase (ribokinase family)
MFWYDSLMRLSIRLAPPGARPVDVVGVGLNSMDLVVHVDTFPVVDSKQEARCCAYLPGGQTATALVACARQGWRTRYVGRFGDDVHGVASRESLAHEGVDVTAATHVPDVANQFAVIVVDAATGSRTIMWQRDARLDMTPGDVSPAVVRSGRILLVDCHQTEVAVTAARLARDAGIPTIVDVEKDQPHVHELLRHIDIIIAAEALPGQLTGHGSLGVALEAMAREFNPLAICVTLGAAGSLTRSQGREIHVPARQGVPVVDTTGAGDAFRGGFIAGWLAAGDEAVLEDVLDWATATAALKCRALGARTAIPDRRQVEDLLGRPASGVGAPG